MKISKISQPIQYTYSQSFRDIYQSDFQNNNTSISQNQKGKKILLKYQQIKNDCLKRKEKIKQNNINQKSLPQKSKARSFNLENKKYSFSVFVKRSKQKNKQKIIKSNQFRQIQSAELQDHKHHENKVLKNTLQNLRKSEELFTKPYNRRWFNLASNSIQKPISVTQRNDDTFFFDEQEKLASVANQKKKSKIYFSKTISFENKIEKDKDKIRRKQKIYSLVNAPKSKSCNIHPKTAQSYQKQQNQGNNQNHNSFFKIQKYNLQRKDQNFIKNCMNFKDMLLRERLIKQNQIKKIQIIANASSFHQNQAYRAVSTLRENKKRKKNKFVDFSQEHTKNQIQPW